MLIKVDESNYHLVSRMVMLTGKPVACEDTSTPNILRMAGGTPEDIIILKRAGIVVEVVPEERPPAYDSWAFV